MRDCILELADRTILVHHHFAYFEKFCDGYLVREDEKKLHIDFTVEVYESDIQRERIISRQEDIREGRLLQSFSDEYLETLAIYRKIAAEMLNYDTLLLHGSAIAVDNQGYLFTASSGTGKSTHTRLWREYLGERAIMVNDDKPLLRIADQEVIVYGTPWDGKHRLSHNISVPLKCICALERGKNNEIQKVSKTDIYSLLVQQTYRCQNPMLLDRTLSLIDKLAKNVALYRLKCNMEPEAAKMAYERMQ